MTRMQAVKEVARILRLAEIESARLESEMLICHCTGTDRAALLAHPETLLTPREQSLLWDLLAGRAEREPLPYLLGTQPFLDFDLVVSPAVLIPRPETETLVECAVRLLPERSTDRAVRVVDVGTGSGAVAIGIARLRPDAIVQATDISGAALAVARDNAARLGAAARVSFGLGNMLQPVDVDWRRRVRLVVSNPPYIPTREIGTLQPEVARYEPRMALDGGPDGLDTIRELVRDAREWLMPGGYLAFEIGMGQGAAVRDLLGQRGYDSIATDPDLAGIERVITGMWG